MTLGGARRHIFVADPLNEPFRARNYASRPLPLIRGALRAILKYYNVKRGGVQTASHPAPLYRGPIATRAAFFFTKASFPGLY